MPACERTCACSKCCCCTSFYECLCTLFWFLLCKWCKLCPWFGDLDKGEKGYQDIDAEIGDVHHQSPFKGFHSKNKVKQSIPSSDYKDDIIDENSIKRRFGHKTKEKFQMLMSKAIEFTNKATENGQRELLKNCSLHIYENDNFYRQESGHGKHAIIVNFENEEVVVEAIGF